MNASPFLGALSLPNFFHQSKQPFQVVWKTTSRCSQNLNALLVYHLGPFAMKSTRPRATQAKSIDSRSFSLDVLKDHPKSTIHCFVIILPTKIPRGITGQHLPGLLKFATLALSGKDAKSTACHEAEAKKHFVGRVVSTVIGLNPQINIFTLTLYIYTRSVHSTSCLCLCFGSLQQAVGAHFAVFQACTISVPLL